MRPDLKSHSQKNCGFEPGVLFSTAPVRVGTKCLLAGLSKCHDSLVGEKSPPWLHRYTQQQQQQQQHKQHRLWWNLCLRTSVSSPLLTHHCSANCLWSCLRTGICRQVFRGSLAVVATEQCEHDVWREISDRDSEATRCKKSCNSLEQTFIIDWKISISNLGRISCHLLCVAILCKVTVVRGWCPGLQLAFSAGIPLWFSTVLTVFCNKTILSYWSFPSAQPREECASVLCWCVWVKSVNVRAGKHLYHRDIRL